MMEAKVAVTPKNEVASIPYAMKTFFTKYLPTFPPCAAARRQGKPQRGAAKIMRLLPKAMLLVAALLLGAEAFAQPYDSVYNIANGNITISENGSYRIYGDGTATTNTITVSGSITANITLHKVNIDVRSAGPKPCAFSISGGATVNLRLSDTSTLRSKDTRAGLEVGGEDDNTLMITSASGKGSTDGVLNAYDGESGGTGIGTAWAENLLGSIYSAPTAAVQKATLSGIVAIAGTATVGDTLRADTTGLTSTPAGVAPGTYAYQWRRNGSSISGANSATYPLTQSDAGAAITVAVTAANLLDSVTSAPVAVGDTSLCGDKISNMNCPSSPGFYGPDGGGGTGYCGGDTINMSCPNFPGYYEPGGGSDTNYCGNGILNVECPLYPGYYKPGGGGGSSSIKHDTITLTYSDTTLWFFPDPNAVGKRDFEWISLDPEVAAVGNAGAVGLAGRGATFIMCLTLPNGAADEQKTKRVVANITLAVAPKPLAIVGTWVDTIKTYDGRFAAGAAAGMLQGVLPRDAGCVSVQAAAEYVGGSHTLPGSGKPIVVSYTLTGSRAFCYVAPPDSSCSGAIALNGSYSDVWGLVTMREEACGAGVPFVGVSVSYAVEQALTGATLTGVALTDKYGRYFVSGLGKGDVMALRPKENVTPQQQILTVNSSVEQAATFTYASEAASLISLTLSDDTGGELARWEREEIGDTVYYALPCNRSIATLNVEYIAPLGVSGSFFYAAEYADEGVAYNQISVDMSKPGRKIVTIVLSSGKRYTVALDKPYGLFDIIDEHLSGRLRVVSNDPAANRTGLQFSACEWWRKRDTDARWLLMEADRLYCTAGPSLSDRFTKSDSMFVWLTLLNDTTTTLETCPDASPDVNTDTSSVAAGESGGDNAGSEGKKSMKVAVYPNPVAAGGFIKLKQSSFADDGEEEEERYVKYSLFSSQGSLILRGDASPLYEGQGLAMPQVPAGIYHLLLEGKNGKRWVAKVAVES
ncbi:MAG: hypothetical protein LBF55_06940 [Prevotellaceae bacterium]|nr:hypothetical protein [Prevotellaceae bacterium]